VDKTNLVVRGTHELAQRVETQAHSELGNFDGVSVRLMPSVTMQQGLTPAYVDVFAKNGRGYERSVRVSMPPPGVGNAYSIKQLHGITMQLSQAMTELLGMRVEMAGKARQLRDQPPVTRKLEDKRED
jgi:hypothetical protein